MKCLRTKCFLLTFLFSFLFILPNCGNQEQDKEQIRSSSPHSGGVYRTPLLNSPITLDPAKVEDNYGISVVRQLFDGLVRFTPDLLIVPALAENWQIEENGKTYHFFLRQNARFHNGRPMTSQDVLFSLSRLIRTIPPPSILPHLLKIAGAQEYRDNKVNEVRGIEAINDYEFLIRLEESYAPFLAALGMHQASIVPREDVNRMGDLFGLNPIGSGPFQLTEWDENKTICLQRFPDYYADPAFLDEIRYIIYPGGQIEEVFKDFREYKLEDMPVYGKIREQLLSKKDIQWFHRPSLSLLFYGINCRDPFLQHPGVRRALSMSIDRQNLNQSVYNHQYEPAGSILPPGMPGYNPQDQGVVCDIAEAKRYLDQALQEGIPIPPSIEVVSSVQSPIAKAELEFIGKVWAQLGITLIPKFISDWAEFEDYLKSDKLQLYRYAWFADLPDPDSVVQPLFGSASTVNYMRYQNEEVDRMLKVARGMLQPTERAEMYQRIENTVLQSMPLIPLVHLSTDRVYYLNVRGIQLNPLGDHTISFHGVWLNQPES